MLRNIVLCAAALALTSACAVYAAPDTVTPQQAAAIEASCTTIMGLRKGEYYYLACHDSLSATAAGLIEGQSRLAAYDACRAKGLAPGSAVLSTCMLDSEPAAPTKVASLAVEPGPVTLPQEGLNSGQSYYHVTHDVQWRREQYSCAQLGLVPGSPAFADCVASLNAELQPNWP